MQGATDDELSRLIPLVYHADGAEIHRNDEHYIWSFASMLVPAGADVWDVKFPITTLRQRHMRENSTKKALLADIARFLKWAVDVLASGVYPQCDFGGAPLDATCSKRAGSPLFKDAWRFAYIG